VAAVFPPPPGFDEVVLLAEVIVGIETLLTGKVRLESDHGLGFIRI